MVNTQHREQAAMDSDALLTPKKKKWRRQFRPKMLKGKPLHYSHIDAARYQKGMDVLIARMVKETEAQIRALFNSDAAEKHFATDDSVASQARIITNKLKEKFQQLFNRRSKGLAENMIESAKKSSRSSLGSSLKQLSGGLTLKTDVLTARLNDVLIATTAENVALIRSIPEQYFGQIQGSVMRSITHGEGLKDLIPAMQKYEGITYRRAKMIAMDQTRKTYNGINLARMDSIGIKEAEWLHSGGSDHPRKTHMEMDGKVFPLTDSIGKHGEEIPGGMYDRDVEEYIQPGQLPNCRCRYRPVIKFNE